MDLWRFTRFYGHYLKAHLQGESWRLLIKVMNKDFNHSNPCHVVVVVLENVVGQPIRCSRRSFRFETHWMKDSERHDM
ncbi:hypothetical protein G4B88_001185 [Cannabis sativa]|uniref:Uncharacterized protein n=1 Tax=Cannabis sativa TaxID=3483 RepID=A0A7J6GHX7_CANSA|nr:hypothetical protein G4B88_001185 [Cannabis sativa]